MNILGKWRAQMKTTMVESWYSLELDLGKAMRVQA